MGYLDIAEIAKALYDNPIDKHDIGIRTYMISVGFNVWQNIIIAIVKQTVPIRVKTKILTTCA